MIAALEDSYRFYEYKMFFLKKMLQFMSHNQIDRVLNVIYKRLTDDDDDVKKGYLRNNLNPLRNSMQIVDTLETISSINKRNSEKAENAKEELTEYMAEYLKSPTLVSKLIKVQANQKDIFGETTLTYFEEYDAYAFMNTSIIDEVL